MIKATQAHNRQWLKPMRIALWATIILLCWSDLRHLSRLFVYDGHTVNDFLGYWSCGRVFLSGGNPYSPSAVEALERSKGWLAVKPLVIWSPPWVYVLMLPFLALEFGLGRIVWFCFNLIVLLSTADYFWKYFGGKGRHPWIARLTVLVFVPSALALNIGQFSPLVIAGIAGFLWAVSRDRDLIAGLFLLPLSAKPHVVYVFIIVLALWIWEERRWKVCVGILMALTLCVLLGALLNGGAYGDYVTAMKSAYGPQTWDPPTLSSALRRLFPRHAMVMEYAPVVVGVSVTILWWFSWRRKFSWRACVIPCLLLSTITAPYNWTTDLVVLLPLAIVLLVRYQTSPALQTRWVIVMIAVQLASVGLLLMPTDYFVLFWVAPALGVIEWFSNRASRRLHLRDCTR